MLLNNYQSNIISIIQKHVNDGAIAPQLNAIALLALVIYFVMPTNKFFEIIDN